MSDTPRTDANACYPSDCGESIDADFARELERENAELRAAIRKAANFLDVHFGVGPPSIDAALATLRSAMQEKHRE